MLPPASPCRSATSPRTASPRCAAPSRTGACELRVGTALWHGDKSFLQLGADVLDVRDPARRPTAPATTPRRCPVTPPRSSSSAPARRTASPRWRTGAARSTSPAAASPSSSRRTCTPRCASRPTGQPCPAVGDVVDVQRPLITTHRGRGGLDREHPGQGPPHRAGRHPRRGDDRRRPDELPRLPDHRRWHGGQLVRQPGVRPVERAVLHPLRGDLRARRRDGRHPDDESQPAWRRPGGRAPRPLDAGAPRHAALRVRLRARLDLARDDPRSTTAPCSSSPPPCSPCARAGC